MGKGWLILVLLVLVVGSVSLLYFMKDSEVMVEKEEINPELLSSISDFKQLHNINDSYIDCIIEESCNGTFQVMLEINSGNNITQISDDLRVYGKIISTDENSIRFKTDNLYELNKLFNSDFVKKIEIYEIKSDKTIESLGNKLYQCDVDNDCVKVSAGACLAGVHFVNKEYINYVESYYIMVNQGVACIPERAQIIKKIHDKKCVEDKCVGVLSPSLLCEEAHLYSDDVSADYLSELVNHKIFFDSNLTLEEMFEMCGIEIEEEIPEEKYCEKDDDCIIAFKECGGCEFEIVNKDYKGNLNCTIGDAHILSACGVSIPICFSHTCMSIEESEEILKNIFLNSTCYYGELEGEDIEFKIYKIDNATITKKEEKTIGDVTFTEVSVDWWEIVEGIPSHIGDGLVVIPEYYDIIERQNDLLWRVQGGIFSGAGGGVSAGGSSFHGCLEIMDYNSKEILVQGFYGYG